MGEVNGTKSLETNQAKLIALLQRVERGVTVAADVQKDSVKAWVLA
jgi:ribosomal protein S12 methylthiotransferase accessory factor YcaO